MNIKLKLKFNKKFKIFFFLPIQYKQYNKWKKGKKENSEKEKKRKVKKIQP